MITMPLYGEAILQLIPQRTPMVMVDALLAFSDVEIMSALDVTPENLFLQESVMEESGLLEHMAQTVAMHTGYSFYIQRKATPTGYIGAIQQVEILRLPRLGEQIQSRAEIVQEFMGVTLVHISSMINNEIIATAQMKTVIASS